jgi:hypothetical protein
VDHADPLTGGSAFFSQSRQRNIRFEVTLCFDQKLGGFMQYDKMMAQQPITPDPPNPDPYPVTDPVIPEPSPEPNPMPAPPPPVPTPPEPIPQFPPDVTF